METLNRQRLLVCAALALVAGVAPALAADPVDMAAAK